MKPLGSYRSDNYTSKAWILPDGTPVDIPHWHYRWILGNGPIVKRFGLVVNDLPDDEGPVRVAAIKAGFFRVNYEIADGRLTVEGILGKAGPAIRAAVAELLRQNSGQVGWVTLHLFNDDVTSLVLNDSFPWANATPGEREHAVQRLIERGRLTP